MTLGYADPALPVEGWVDVDLPLERLWEVFADAESWPTWNPCFARVWVRRGELHEGDRFAWLFNPIRWWYLYRMPVVARLVEWRPRERVTWEVSLPGFHARHSYRFAARGADGSRFGSWEVAEGAAYERLRAFWLAHFHYVCRSSLAGAESLAHRRTGVTLDAYGPAGSTPPLIVIPGIDGSIGSVAPIVERLAARRRVLVADYTGEHNASLERLTEEIARVAGDRISGEIDLLGQSIGSLAAAKLAAGGLDGPGGVGPLSVRRTVLIATFTSVRDTDLRVADALSAVTPFSVQRMATPGLMAFVCGPVGDGRHRPFFAAVRAANFARTRRRTAWQIGRDFSPVLRAIRGPLLILLGDRDRFVPPDNGERVRAAVANGGRVVGIPDGGHVLLPSATIDRAVEQIEEFLR
jgi:pimeloyl-ACP methyl ester carboxylesterase